MTDLFSRYILALRERDMPLMNVTMFRACSNRQVSGIRRDANNYVAVVRKKGTSLRNGGDEWCLMAHTNAARYDGHWLFEMDNNGAILVLDGPWSEIKFNGWPLAKVCGQTGEEIFVALLNAVVGPPVEAPQPIEAASAAHDPGDSSVLQEA